MDTIVGFLQSLPNVLGPVLSTAMGLIALDLGLGVAIALRKGVFEWKRVIVFYRTNVFPFAIAAVVIAASAQFISAEVMPPELMGPIADLGTLIGVGPMFAYLVLGSIIPNVKALVLGKLKWEILNPQLAQAIDAKLANYMSVGSVNPPPPPETGGYPAAPDDAVDVALEALNEDGTAVDQYDPETLAHVGSESVVGVTDANPSKSEWGGSLRTRGKQSS